MTGERLELMGAVARPVSVVWYERLAWTALALGLVSAAANPAALAKHYAQNPIGYPIMFAVSIAGQLIWIWLVGRKRQNWARWISLLWLLLAIFGTADMIGDVRERFQLTPVTTSLYHVALVIWMISIMLLFRSDAREWFSRKRVASGA